MDLLKNPFHILGATPRDNRQRIMELAEEQSLLSDPNKCAAARAVLINPRNRISAEVAWLPGVNPEHIESVLKQLVSPSQYLLNIIGLSSIASANVFTAGLSRLSNIASTNLVEWILAIAHAYEKIDPEEVRGTLNEERNLSGFPQIADLSVITAEIQNQRRYYSQTLSFVINNLSVAERARILTLTLETVIGNDNNRYPILIDDLIQSYEVEVGNDLEKKQKIIEAQDKKLRSMADAKNPDTTLQPIVNQLIEAVKDWDTIAQPIQLSKRSRGERHAASFEIASHLRILGADLFKIFSDDPINEYGKFEFSWKILNMIKEVFAEVPEIVEGIDRDLKLLKEQIPFVTGVKKFKEISTQVEKLKEAADAKKPDYTLTPMVNQLIQNVMTWEPYKQPIEANEVVAIVVRNIAIHLWNEHQKREFAIQITFSLTLLFKRVPGMDKINKQLVDDTAELIMIKQEWPRGGTGCLLQIIIFSILGLIGALLQGC